ncbi:SEC-C metal-binding domain-containing protein [Brevibacillus gelatini]
MKVGRNAPCPCGSGKKYKKCCLPQDELRGYSPSAPQDSKALLFLFMEEEFDWDHEQYELIARNLVHSMYPQYEPGVIAFAIQIWNLYANNIRPIVRKTGVMEAAIEYCVAQVLDLPVTQAALSEKYGVSVGTISKRVQEIFDEEWLFETIFQENNGQQTHPQTPLLSAERAMYEITNMVKGKEFESTEQLNEFINAHLSGQARKTKNASLDPKEMAQNLLYDAWEEPSATKRVKLAKQALQLYPDSPDAYNILAESSEDLEEAIQFYKQGKEAGERELGLRSFHEDRGHFWGLIHTRPYMRSKEGYANCLLMAGQLELAEKEFAEMLDLNPHDNQGVRYSLLSIYIELNKFEKASRLLETYEENSAYMNYSRVLLAYMKNGPSAKLDHLLDKAIQQNPYVIDFLLGRKKLPGQAPDYYRHGDTSEAIMYVNANYHLWRREGKLLQWLKKHKAVGKG